MARLKEQCQAEGEAWRTRRLDDLRVVYLWVDGVYVKAGLERERAALLVAVAGLMMAARWWWRLPRATGNQ